MYRSKFLTLAAASAVALSLAACGGSDDDSDTTSGGTGAASPGGGAEGASITLMVGVKGDPFYVSMECGAQEAADAAGATLEACGRSCSSWRHWPLSAASGPARAVSDSSRAASAPRTTRGAPSG